MTESYCIVDKRVTPCTEPGGYQMVKFIKIKTTRFETGRRRPMFHEIQNAPSQNIQLEEIIRNYKLKTRNLKKKR